MAVVSMDGIRDFIRCGSLPVADCVVKGVVGDLLQCKGCCVIFAIHRVFAHIEGSVARECFAVYRVRIFPVAELGLYHNLNFVEAGLLVAADAKGPVLISLNASLQDGIGCFPIGGECETALIDKSVCECFV